MGYRSQKLALSTIETEAGPIAPAGGGPIVPAPSIAVSGLPSFGDFAASPIVSAIKELVQLNPLFN